MLHNQIGLCAHATPPSTANTVSLASAHIKTHVALATLAAATTLTPYERLVSLCRLQVTPFDFTLDPLGARILGRTQIVSSLKIEPRPRIPAEKACEP